DLQFGSRTRPPDQPAIIDEAVDVVGQDPPAALDLDQTVGPEGRRPAWISDYIILACADIFISDSSGERARRTDRHDNVAASEGGAEAIVERAVGRGGEIARAERPPKGQPPGPHADARAGIVRRRIIESVGEPEAIEMVVDRGVADPVARVDRER